MTMFFERRIGIRIRSEDYDAIQKVTKNMKDVYDNESHFIRCAIMRLLRTENPRAQKIIADKALKRRVKRSDFL